MPLVDFEEAKVVFARHLQTERTSGDSLQLGALVKAKEAGDLARLQEVKLVGARGWCGSVSLDALE